jgi:imidazolonepropionase-like amidohydrolase
MRASRVARVAVTGTLTALTLAHALPAQDGSRPLVILHATVIDPATSSAQPDRAVVVRGHKIADVVAAAGFQTPAGARVVDASGQFLIPGLWDMHVHSAFGDWFPGGRDVILPLFIANGVTGVRDMGGDLPPLLGWRAAITAGTLVGPRMVMSGPMLDGYLADGKSMRFPSSVPVTSPADAVAAVRSLASQHVDFIKVQSEVPHDAYLAATAEAHRLGLPIVGHVPTRVRVGEVIDAGQKSIEHLMGLFEGCSTQEDKFIAGNGSMQLLLQSYDPARCDALLKRLAQAQVWQCPTLFWQRGETLLDLVDQNNQPLARYVPMSWRTGSWRKFTESIMVDIAKDPLSRRQEYWHRNLTMTGALHRAGVPILAGTDAAPGVFVVPGFSLHDELAEMVEAGLTPMEALQTATSNPARFWDRTDIGRVAPGTLADLVLLSKDPTVDIHNTTSIRAVVADGKLYDRGALDGLLHGVENAAKTAGGAATKAAAGR